jgi:beta-glucosidase/6-phospho-beta-glucosidase/beta-galactosidase
MCENTSETGSGYALIKLFHDVILPSRTFQVHPSGLRHLLNWIRKEYDNPEVIVTENGVSDKGSIKLRIVSRFLYSNIL